MKLCDVNNPDSELIKSLRNTVEFLWNEGWYAKSMRLSEVAELFEKYSAMYNVVDSACVTRGFDFDLGNPAESLNKLICEGERNE